jgi:hypothetical protein
LLGKLPSETIILKKQTKETDFIHFFTTQKSELEQTFSFLKNLLSKNGMLWISWPKRISGVNSDLGENIVREIGLKHGLVDIKVCAVDETWSALKFVFRIKDR